LFFLADEGAVKSINPSSVPSSHNPFVVDTRSINSLPLLLMLLDSESLVFFPLDIPDRLRFRGRMILEDDDDAIVRLPMSCAADGVILHTGADDFDAGLV